MPKHLISHTLIVLSCLQWLALPVQAQHQHGQPQAPTADSAEHTQQMDAVLKDAQVFSARALDLLSMGNALLEQGHAKKDAKLMLKGASLFESGTKLHEHGMHSLRDIHQGLRRHLMMAGIDEMAISDVQRRELQTRMNGLKTAMQEHHQKCQAEMLKSRQNASRLVDFGNQIMLQAQKSGNSDQMELGSQLLSTGLKLHQAHAHRRGGMGEEMDHAQSGMERQPMIRREIEIRKYHQP